MHGQGFPKEQYSSSAIVNYKELSDEEVIRLCLKNERKAWEEFFRRFIPLIKKSIQGRLIARGLENLCHDKDILSDIHEKIVVKLYGEGKLKECKNLEGIVPWLKRVSKNQTSDWIKERNRDKRLPKRYAEMNTISLSEPINGEYNLRFEDILSDKNKSNLILRSNLEKSLNSIVGIEDKQKYWVFRLSIITTLPLLNEEIRELSVFSKIDLEQLKEKIEDIYEDVMQKERKKSESFGKAVLYWYKLKRLKAAFFVEENRVKAVYNNRAPGNLKLSKIERQNQQNLAMLKGKIEKEEKKRAKELNKINKLCRPSNKAMAELVGIPEDKVGQISNILKRLREKLVQKKTNDQEILSLLNEKDKDSCEKIF